jgi:hypothetical protein
MFWRSSTTGDLADFEAALENLFVDQVGPAHSLGTQGVGDSDRFFRFIDPSVLLRDLNQKQIFRQVGMDDTPADIGVPSTLTDLSETRMGVRRGRHSVCRSPK